MKITILFTIVLNVVSFLSQAQTNEPLTMEGVLEMYGQFDVQTSQKADRGLTQQLDSSRLYNYSYWGQTWYVGPISRYSYYTDGTLQSKITETENAWNETLEYDSTGKILLEKQEQWIGSIFENIFLTNYVYTNDGAIQSDTSYEWINDVWEITKYSEYQVDAQGYVLEKSGFEVIGGVTFSDYIYSFINDANGKLLNLTTQVNLGGQMVNNYYYSYSYTSFDRVEEYLSQDWVNGAWENIQKTEFTYVANDQLRSKSYSWMNGAWVYDTQKHFQYDTNVPTTDVWLPESMKENTHIMMENQKYFNYYGSWEYSDSSIFYYSAPEPSSVASLSNNSIYRLQTNPVSTEIRIVNEQGVNSEIHVYSCTGKLMQSLTSNASVISVNTSKLTNGLYFVHINNGNESEVLKAMVSK